MFLVVSGLCIRRFIQNEQEQPQPQLSEFSAQSVRNFVHCTKIRTPEISRRIQNASGWNLYRMMTSHPRISIQIHKLFASYLAVRQLIIMLSHIGQKFGHKFLTTQAVWKARRFLERYELTEIIQTYATSPIGDPVAVFRCSFVSEFRFKTVANCPKLGRLWKKC